MNAKTAEDYAQSVSSHRGDGVLPMRMTNSSDAVFQAYLPRTRLRVILRSLGSVSSLIFSFHLAPVLYDFFVQHIGSRAVASLR